MAGGEGPARDSALHAPCTADLGPLTALLWGQCITEGRRLFSSAAPVPPPHPLHPLLKAWEKAPPGRRPRCDPAVTRGHHCPSPPSPDLSRSPRSFTFAPSRSDKRFGPPGADARGALRLWAPAGLARHPFPGSPSHGVATRAPSTGPSQEAAPTASRGGGLRPGRVSPGPDVSSVTFPTP